MTSSAAALGFALAASFGSAAWAQSAPASLSPTSTPPTAASATEVHITAARIAPIPHAAKTDVSASAVSFADLNNVPSAQSNNTQSSSTTSSSSSAPPQEIVVTGSRIARRDYTSNSPIVTLNSESFQNTANVAVEATLNKLPQFAPAQNLMGIFNAGDIQNSATHAVGISTASLRSLGANRTLVLLDGRRMTPVDGLNDVDLNTIPSSAIDRVETITGGASAVYGADAVGGVVNFILKKNYQGLTIDSQYGEAEDGDDQEFKISALAGTNFADDRGNIMFGVERYQRGATWEKNRDFFTNSWNDPTVAGNEFGFVPGASWLLYANGPSLAAINSTFPGLGPTTSPNGNPINQGLLGAYGSGIFAPSFRFNSDGSLWSNTIGGQVAMDAYTGTPNGTSIATVRSYDSASFNLSSPTFGADPTTPPNIITGPKFNRTNNYLLSPEDRYSLFGQMHYDLTDNLTFFFNGDFERTSTTTTTISPDMVTGFDVLVPYDSATGGVASGHPVPAGLQTLLNSRGTYYCSAFDTVNCSAFFGFATLWNGGPSGTSKQVQTFNPALVGTLVPGTGPDQPWALEVVPPFPGWLPDRTNTTNANTFQVTTGFDGKLPSINWNWELFASHGESAQYLDAPGNISVERWRALVLAPNWGQNFSFLGNSDPTNPSPGTGGAFGTCTSGLYDTLFKGGTPSQDCIDAITADLQSYTLTKQDIVEFDAQGDVFDLPAGMVKASMGADYRRNSLTFRGDNLQSFNSFLDNPVGVYPQGKSSGTVVANEGYGEALIPILKDLPFVKSLSLDLGVRYSTYTNSPSGWTYMGTANWQVLDWLTFHGGYNLAVRAPSVGESYQASTQTFAFVVGSDPCSLQSTPLNYGATGANNAQLATTNPTAVPPTPISTIGPTPQLGAESTYALCRAMMGNILPGGSSPLAPLPGGTGADTYYTTSQPAAGTGNPPFVNYIGNPNLSPELAKTWTAGFVIQSPIRSPWLARTSLRADWYSIIIDHTIGLSPLTVTQQPCFTQYVLDGAGNVDAAALAAALASPACKANARVPTTGGIIAAVQTYENLGYLKTTGIDVQGNWGVDFADIGAKFIPGSVNLNVLFNYLDHWLSRGNVQDPTSLLTENAGYGANFRFRVNSTLTYIIGPATVSLNMQYLPTARAAGWATYKAQLAAFNAGIPGVAQPSTVLTYDTAAHTQFDLAATYAINDRYQLRAGIDNLLDAEPELTAAAAGGFTTSVFGGSWSLPTTGAGITNTGYYDAIGRRFYFGINAKF